MQKINLETIFKNSLDICKDIQSNVELKKINNQLLKIIFLCSGLYGLTMGFSHSWQQSLSSLFKVPILYLLTLFICIPTLHFAGLFLGSRISFFQSIAILLLGIASNAAFLLGFTTIVIFFLLTGSSYKFLLLMHVFFFIIGGLVGLISINRSYSFLSSELDDNPKNRKTLLLKIWMLMYMFVGTQMAYILSPFVGKEEQFYLFHNTQRNFYSYVYDLTFDRFEEKELDPKRAEDLVAEKARIAINSIKEKNFIRLATLLGNSGLKIILNSLPSNYLSNSIDPIYTSATLIEAFEKNKEVIIEERDIGDYTVPKMKIKKSFLEIYSEYLYDYPYADKKIIPNFNTFTLGRDHKDKLRSYFPKAIFVEYPNLQDDGRWTALRLIFEPSNDYKNYTLIAIVHDKNSN
ncbi:MAG: hypothetical protein SFU98_16830 [Leptospiraceae bacterium]|nr:hypothetical protein [Leptospiraceae bacterium]